MLAFRSTKLPAPSQTQNLGLILMTLFAAFVDKTIKLTNDKSALFDKCWTTGVVPYFKNSGRVVTNLKKLKDALDFHAQEEKSWAVVFTPTM